MKIFLEKILNGSTLSSDESYLAMQRICSLENENPKIAAFLAVLQSRGETTAEIIGFANYLREQSLQINLNDSNIIDVCGTGGDCSGTFNISTASALVLASDGVKVAKHGGRSVTSKSGYVDVLNALDIALSSTPTELALDIEQQNIAFISALEFNPAFKKMAPLRKELGIRTCFNLLGPLLNPVKIKRQIIGVYSKKLLLPVAEILLQTGHEEAMIVHSHDGLDEISISAPTDIVHVIAGNIHQLTVEPETVGLSRGTMQNVQGGTPKENAEIIKQIFRGEQSARSDIVALNAAAGFMLAGKTDSLVEGVERAKKIMLSGQAHEFMQSIRRTK